METGVHQMPKKKESLPATQDQVCNLVMGILGTPPNYCSCSATNVFGNFWRVNVRAFDSEKRNSTITPTTITDSFLVKIENSQIQSGDPVTPKYKS